jgi:uncharacterized protein YigE (DUF2233 family)
MRAMFVRVCVSGLSSLLLCAAAGADEGWTRLPSGLEHRREERGWSTFELVRVDLRRFRLAVADARREGRARASVPDLLNEAGGVAAINGTFFDADDRPLGLLVSDGRQLNPVKRISWWAVLGVYEDAGGRRADVQLTADFLAQPPERRAALRFALQVGPRTVVDGAPLKLKEQSADRSAVCLRGPEEVVLVATHGAGVESNELAAWMAGPLGCRAGLMLDGGPSTALQVAGDPPIEVAGGSDVANALVVVPATAR